MLCLTLATRSCLSTSGEAEQTEGESQEDKRLHRQRCLSLSLWLSMKWIYREGGQRSEETPRNQLLQLTPRCPLIIYTVHNKLDQNFWDLGTPKGIYLKPSLLEKQSLKKTKNAESYEIISQRASCCFMK